MTMAVGATALLAPLPVIVAVTVRAPARATGLDDMLSEVTLLAWLMDCVIAAEVAAGNGWPLLYEALMLWVPTLSNDVVSVALAKPSSTTVCSNFVPSKKETWPVGRPRLAAPGLTSAMKTTG